MSILRVSEGAPLFHVGISEEILREKNAIFFSWLLVLKFIGNKWQCTSPACEEISAELSVKSKEVVKKWKESWRREVFQ